MGHWPVGDTLEMARLRPGVVSLCRRRPPVALPEGAPVLAAAHERLALVFTELTTNALRHARPPVAVTLLCGDDTWLVLVSDAAAQAVPRPRSPSPAETGGRGLGLVASLAETTGWYISAEGKTVWAEIADHPADLIERLSRR